MATAIERAENRVKRANEALTKTQDELAAANAARSALEEVQGFLPQTVTPAVRQGIAAGTGVGIGVITQATGLPDPLLPAGVTVLGAGAQFLLDLTPDWNEAAISITEGASGVLGFLLGKYTTKGVMEQILHATPAAS